MAQNYQINLLFSEQKTWKNDDISGHIWHREKIQYLFSKLIALHFAC